MRQLASAIKYKFERGPQYHKLMVRLSHLTKRLATMCTAYEYLATISMIAQKMKTGYTTARFRRFIMSHSDFRDWTHELQKEYELFENAMQ